MPKPTKQQLNNSTFNKSNKSDSKQNKDFGKSGAKKDKDDDKPKLDLDSAHNSGFSDYLRSGEGRISFEHIVYT
jgi:hypothetical protein